MKPAEGSTVIGRSVTIHGELSGKEDLYMDGVVEGTISLPESRLTVGPNARVLADVDARDVVVYGLVEGNIRATGRIELRESCVMKGDLVAGRLSIEENATIKGKVEVSEPPPIVAPSSAVPANAVPSSASPKVAETPASTAVVSKLA